MIEILNTLEVLDIPEGNPFDGSNLLVGENIVAIIDTFHRPPEILVREIRLINRHVGLCAAY